MLMHTNVNALNLRSLPPELRQGKRYVTWDLVTLPGESKPTKIPYQPRDKERRKADSTNPETWGTFDEALTVGN